MTSVASYILSLCNLNPVCVITPRDAGTSYRS